MGVPALERLQFEAWHFCAGYRQNPKRGQLMVIYGNNGVGKSLVAKGMCKWAFDTRANFEKIAVSASEVKVPDVKFFAWSKFLDRYRDGEREHVQDAYNCCLLILDEVGGAHDPFAVGTDKLCSILSSREFKWTVITTNLTPENWETAFDRRIASRFFRNAIHVEMNNVNDYHVL